MKSLLENKLKDLYDGGILNDIVHSEKFKEKRPSYLSKYFLNFIDSYVSDEDKVNIFSSDEKKRLDILVKAMANIPFDYLGNSIKFFNFKKREGDYSENSYMRSPEELLDDHFKFKTGGDCFSTSLTLNYLLSVFDIDSKLVLCHDNMIERDFRNKHHCALVAKANGNDYYIDTSLNLEVPILINQSFSDSEDSSSIFRLNLVKKGNIVKVDFSPRTKKSSYSIDKTRNTLWYFNILGDQHREVLGSMVYALNPSKPTNLLFNKNQNFLLSKFENGLRKFIYYNEKKNCYVYRENSLYKKGSYDLNVGHLDNGIISDSYNLCNFVNLAFGIDFDRVYESIKSLNYINTNFNPNFKNK